MRKLLLLSAMLVSTSAFAQLRCIDKLLPIPRPSATHQLTATEWRAGETGLMTPEDATRAVMTLAFAKLLCRESEIEFPQQATCAPVDVNVPGSNTCYISSTLGFFIINQDSAKNANIIFNKTKRVRSF